MVLFPRFLCLIAYIDFSIKLMENKNLYNTEVYDECIKRINKITQHAQGLWGKMDSAQMFAHCAEIVETTNGKEIKGTPFLVKLFASMIRKMVVNDKPYKKNTQTHPQYKQTAPKNFEEEKLKLLNALEVFYTMDKSVAEKIKHTLFGTMTLDERGWSMYKHLDHHLTQFGA